MHLLGSLGIDINLLIAQLINFGLLVWLLSYFVYKPSIRLIEKNEQELVEGRRMKIALDDDKRMFGHQKEKELGDMKSGNRQTLEEMAAAAKMLQYQTSKKADMESAAIIDRTKSALEGVKPMMEKELEEKLNKKMAERFRVSFDGSVPAQQQAEFQKILFGILLKRIDEAPVEKIKPEEIKELKKVAAKSAKEYKRKLRERAGEVILEYAVELPARDRAVLERKISEKLGLRIMVELKRNKRLVSGFRLELAGRLIDSSLATIIEHAQTN